MGIRNGVGPHKLLGGIGKETRDFFLFGIASHTNDKLPKGVITNTAIKG